MLVHVLIIDVEDTDNYIDVYLFKLTKVLNQINQFTENFRPKIFSTGRWIISSAKIFSTFLSKKTQKSSLSSDFFKN